jgi:hypothetical protein
MFEIIHLDEPSVMIGMPPPDGSHVQKVQILRSFGRDLPDFLSGVHHSRDSQLCAWREHASLISLIFPIMIRQTTINPQAVHLQTTR